MSLNKFSIGTLNVGGFKSRPSKIISVFEFVKNLDVIIFQETHFSAINDFFFFEQVFRSNFFIFHSLAHEKFSGVCTLFNKKVFEEKFTTELDIAGRCLAISLSYSGFAFLFVCIYAPAQPIARQKFF